MKTTTISKEAAFHDTINWLNLHGVTVDEKVRKIVSRQLMRYGGNVELVTDIGFPLYVTNILGTWKLLGVIAIVMPGFPRLKEWAYSGIFFLMTGAALSHAFAHDYGDYGFHVILPLFYAALAMASWALRPKSRRL
ncbi:MAG: DoxX family protein [Paenibacillaceae bacterium]|nr:DoxX family protein [Paenibacillaceae bacterium]